jgi:hypothetical protein
VVLAKDADEIVLGSFLCAEAIVTTSNGATHRWCPRRHGRYGTFKTDEALSDYLAARLRGEAADIAAYGARGRTSRRDASRTTIPMRRAPM